MLQSRHNEDRDQKPQSLQALEKDSEPGILADRVARARRAENGSEREIQAKSQSDDGYGVDQQPPARPQSVGAEPDGVRAAGLRGRRN
jgi:hypothetical protein